MPYDADAAPALLAVMDAAGRHDGADCLHALDEAASAVGPHRHQAHPEIDRARTAVAGRDWVHVWVAAYQAICLLTWVFPPDLQTCPPRPGPHPRPARADCPGCAHPTGPAATFCAHCGTRLT